MIDWWNNTYSLNLWQISTSVVIFWNFAKIQISDACTLKFFERKLNSTKHQNRPPRMSIYLQLHLNAFSIVLSIIWLLSLWIYGQYHLQTKCHFTYKIYILFLCNWPWSFCKWIKKSIRCNSKAKVTLRLNKGDHINCNHRKMIVYCFHWYYSIHIR